MTRLLIAGLGNIFLGDDAFGVEVVRQLLDRPWPAGVRVADYGIRGLDLVDALLEEPAAVILIDALPRGGAPGTLYVLEPDLDDLGGPAASPMINAHALDPAQALHMVQALGGCLRCVRIVGCEPATFGTDLEPALELSAPVRASVGEAVRLVESLAVELLTRVP